MSMTNIKLGIKLPSNVELKKEMQSVVKYLEKNALVDMKLDVSSFNKSISQMSKELDKLKNQLSKFNVLEVKTDSLFSSAGNVEVFNQSLENLSKTTKTVDIL